MLEEDEVTRHVTVVPHVDVTTPLVDLRHEAFFLSDLLPLVVLDDVLDELVPRAGQPVDPLLDSFLVCFTPDPKDAIWIEST